MTQSKKQPEALRLADLIDSSWPQPGSVSGAAASELRRLHERDTQADAQIKELLQVIEDMERSAELLSQRVQELGEMARENRSKRVVELEGRIAEMEEQMAAIGAGGVEPLRKRAEQSAVPHTSTEQELVQIEWRDPENDWAWFWLLDMRGEWLHLRGANYPDGSGKHCGDCIWVHKSDVQTMRSNVSAWQAGGGSINSTTSMSPT